MRVLADGRVRRTEAEWRGLIERFEQSGQSMAAFCRRARVPRDSFMKWRARLEERPRAARPREPAPAAFVEWIPPSDSPTRVVPGGGASEFELSLPGGVVLRWKG